jgi:Flp pilus assembly protein TadG
MIHMILERLKRGIFRQDGNVAVLAAVVLAALMGMTAVVVDGGKVYAVKMHLQKTANATVLSGAQELTATEQNVRDVANHVLQDHGEAASLVNLSVAMKDRTTAVMKKDVAMGLAKVLGFAKVPVSVKATAKIEAMGEAVGVVPVGIPESKVLSFGQETRLKVDNDEEQNGNFGILEFGDTQQSDYEKNLKYGFDGSLYEGKFLGTKGGNVAQQTERAVDFRMSATTPALGDDPRLLLVPVYIACPDQDGITKDDCINYQDTGHLKKVYITGFAYFYLTKPYDSSNKEIIGKFIEHTGRGFSKPGAVNRGAYAIKLTE